MLIEDTWSFNSRNRNLMIFFWKEIWRSFLEPSLVYLPVGIFATKGMFRTWCLSQIVFFRTCICPNPAKHGRFAHSAIYQLYCLVWVGFIKVNQTEWPWCWTPVVFSVFLVFKCILYTWNWVVDGFGGTLVQWSEKMIRLAGVLFVRIRITLIFTSG